MDCGFGVEERGGSVRGRCKGEERWTPIRWKVSAMIRDGLVRVGQSMLYGRMSIG